MTNLEPVFELTLLCLLFHAEILFYFVLVNNLDLSSVNKSFGDFNLFKTVATCAHVIGCFSFVMLVYFLFLFRVVDL